jgi:hypothetical protein
MKSLFAQEETDALMLVAAKIRQWIGACAAPPRTEVQG